MHMAHRAAGVRTVGLAAFTEHGTKILPNLLAEIGGKICFGECLRFVLVIRPFLDWNQKHIADRTALARFKIYFFTFAFHRTVVY